MVPLVFVIGKLVRFINGDPVDSFIAAVRETGFLHCHVLLKPTVCQDRLVKASRNHETEPFTETRAFSTTPGGFRGVVKVPFAC